MKTEELEIVLRSLDAAPAALTASERQRADAALEEIVTTPPDVDVTRDRPPALTRKRMRLALVPVALAALVIGFVVLQSDGSSMAYASWTPTPSEVAEPALAAAEDVCHDKVRDDDTIDGENARRVLAERRGDVVALICRP